MVFGEIIAFPFIISLVLLFIILAVLLTIFWVWMLVDCAKRNFKNDTEKIVWVIIIALTSWLGALIYYIVVKNANPKGLSKKS